ncbi:MAG: DUF2764 family protein [Bacteroidales bacterium]|jgi:hypothetical protein|nr:DUF2764 family protein [Bacteroidales bacterium]
MFKRHYYYLVAGLADLIFDNKAGLSIEEFREELRVNLHPADFSLVSLLFLPHDNNNLLEFLSGKEDRWDENGTYTLADFEEQKRVIESILKEKDVLPGYMVDIMTGFYGSEEGIDEAQLRKKLSEGYINMVLGSGNRFLEQWIRYDTDINNIYTFLNAKKLGLDVEKHLIGDDSLAAELRELYRSGKDFVIPFEPDYAQAIFRIATENEFHEAEKKTDLERWSYLDSLTFFEYFTIDQVLGYLLRFLIVKRWERLDPETGKKMLKMLVEGMESDVIAGSLNDK